jgi:hypothetical protein
MRTAADFDAYLNHGGDYGMSKLWHRFRYGPAVWLLFRPWWPKRHAKWSDRFLINTAPDGESINAIVGAAIYPIAI